MIYCRQWYLDLLPYKGTALNLIDIKSAVLDLRRKTYSGSILFKKIWARLKNYECIWATDGNYNQHLLPKFVCVYWALFPFETRDLRPRSNDKDEKCVQ